MKKLIIIITACMVHTHSTQSMQKYLIDTGKSAVHYAEKWVNPEGYILDSQNKELYKTVLEAINTKDISTLRTSQFSDKDNVLHSFEDTFGKRITGRLDTLISCVLYNSLIQDPVLRKNSKLHDMLNVNELIIPDLYQALALLSLRESGVPVSNTGSIIVDVILHKISLLPEKDQILLKDKLEDKSKRTSASLTEEHFKRLPITEQQELLEKMQKHMHNSTETNNPKTVTNSRRASPSNSFVPKNIISVDQQKKQEKIAYSGENQSDVYTMDKTNNGNNDIADADYVNNEWYQQNQ